MTQPTTAELCTARAILRQLREKLQEFITTHGNKPLGTNPEILIEYNHLIQAEQNIRKQLREHMRKQITNEKEFTY